MTLNFSDGKSIDTSGPIRTLNLSDGWYVVGMGMLIPVVSQNEAITIADDLKKNHTRNCATN